MSIEYPGCPLDNNNQDPSSVRIWLRQIAGVASRNNQGKFNVFGSITLTSGATTTVVVDQRLTISSVIVFSPTNAHSSSEFVSGNFYADYSTLTNGSITVRHTNNGVTDRTFKYVILG